MQNLLDAYGEESQSSHISIVNDDESIVVDSDPEKEQISAGKSSKASKNKPKRYKPQSDIMQFFGRRQQSQLVELETVG